MPINEWFKRRNEYLFPCIGIALFVCLLILTIGIYVELKRQRETCATQTQLTELKTEIQKQINQGTKVVNP